MTDALWNYQQTMNRYPGYGMSEHSRPEPSAADPEYARQTLQQNSAARAAEIIRDCRQGQAQQAISDVNPCQDSGPTQKTAVIASGAITMADVTETVDEHFWNLVDTDESPAVIAPESAGEKQEQESWMKIWVDLGLFC